MSPDEHFKRVTCEHHTIFFLFVLLMMLTAERNCGATCVGSYCVVHILQYDQATRAQIRADSRRFAQIRANVSLSVRLSSNFMWPSCLGSRQNRYRHLPHLKLFHLNIKPPRHKPSGVVKYAHHCHKRPFNQQGNHRDAGNRKNDFIQSKK